MTLLNGFLVFAIKKKYHHQNHQCGKYRMAMYLHL